MNISANFINFNTKFCAKCTIDKEKCNFSELKPKNSQDLTQKKFVQFFHEKIL